MGWAQRKWTFLYPPVAMVADGFPGEHLHVDYSQDLWQKQVSEHLDLAYIKHSLAKHKNATLPNCFLHVDRGVRKCTADRSHWDQEPLISDQDQIQEWVLRFSNCVLQPLFPHVWVWQESAENSVVVNWLFPTSINIFIQGNNNYLVFSHFLMN